MSQQKRTSVLNNSVNKQNVLQDYEPQKDIGQKFLEEIGYKQIFFRNLTLQDVIFFYLVYIQTNQYLFMNIGENLVLVSATNLIITYIINSIGQLILSYTLDEIISAYPSAGSLYTVIFILSPKNWCKQISLLVGYFQYIGQTYLYLEMNILMVDSLQKINSIFLDSENQFSTNIYIFLTFFITIFTNFINSILIGQRLRIFVYFTFIFLISFFFAQILFFWKFTERYSDVNYIFDINIKLEFATQLNFFKSFRIWILAFVGQGVGNNISEQIISPQTISRKSIMVSYCLSIIIGLVTILTFIFTTRVCSYEDYQNIQRDTSYTNILKIIFTSKDFSGEFILDKLSYFIVCIYAFVNFLLQSVITNFVVVQYQFAFIRDGCFPFSRYIYQTDVKNQNNIIISNTIQQLIFLSILIFLPQITPALKGLHVTLISLSLFMVVGINFYYKTIDFKNSQFNSSKYSFIFELITILWLIFQNTILMYPYEYDGDYQFWNSNFFSLLLLCIMIMIYYYFPKYGCGNTMRGPIRWDDRIGQNKKLQKTNFQRVLDLYALVENKRQRFA